MSMSKRIASLTLAVMLLASGVQVYAEESSEVYYKSDIFTRTLGNYQFGVEAHEIPQQEVLPIVDKSFFPYTVTKFATEVDNTAPSATYKSKPISKVDVVFALGELSQMEMLQACLPEFKTRLGSASNNIDAKITSVETVTGGFTMEDAEAATIYNFWDQYPNPNNYLLYGNYICNLYGRWGPQYFKNDGTNAFDQAFIERDSWDVSDFEFNFDIKLHGCQWGSGAILRWDRQRDVGYILLCSNFGGEITLRYVEGLSQYIGQAYQPESLGRVVAWLSCEPRTAYPYNMAVDSGNYSSVHVKMTGNKIDIRCDCYGSTYTIPDRYYIKSGGIGLFAGCCVAYANVQLAYEKIITKTLGDAISDVSWRDGATRFIVHATDITPADMADISSKDYINTVSKLSDSNAYLLNLGTWGNEGVLTALAKTIQGADGEVKGVFINNSPITYALDRSAQWVVDKAKGLQKPNDYVLVGEEMSWETQYKDNEKDVPLNFGKNASDRNLALNWGIGFTDKYKDDSLLAEKWRYRHNNAFYDNSAVRATFSDEWLADSVKVFEQPGLYRVNYKRRDNPIVPDYSLTSIFDNYRYWSTDYDVYKPNN